MVADTANGRSLKGWWRAGPRIPTLLLFAIVALALLGTFALIFATIETERLQRRQAERTSAVLVSLNQIIDAALNGETGQRGYFITNDKRYLAPYWDGHGRYRTEIARLRQRLGSSTTDQQDQLIDEIARLSDAKWSEMGATITMVDNGQIVEAHNRILSDEGQLAMVALRGAVARLERVERTRLAETATSAAEAESRILPSLALLLVVIVCALALGLWQALRTARAEATAANAEVVAQARDRADLLAQELNHRVKNLFAVILAIVQMSARGDAGGAPAVDRIAKRIRALVTAHDVTQGRTGDAEMDLGDLIEKVIAPYRSRTERCELEGSTLVIAARHAVPLGLVLHELVTNAVKYGAWSAPGGLLQVGWRIEDGRVKVNWCEHNANDTKTPLNDTETPPNATKPAHEGFGTMLIRSSARQLGGTIERRFEPAGIVVEMDFPAIGEG
jgi:two-component sensor histidine kinase